MQPMTTIRNWQIDQLKKAVSTLQYVIKCISQEDATTLRDGGSGWTVLEVMGHLRDFEAVFVERAHLTIDQDMPDLPFPDQEALAVERRYNEGDLQETYREWADNRLRFIAFLESVGEGGWERPANHPTRGPFTLNDQLLLTVWHDMNHIEQIAHIMVERKGA